MISMLGEDLNYSTKAGIFRLESIVFRYSSLQDQITMLDLKIAAWKKIIQKETFNIMLVQHTMQIWLKRRPTMTQKCFLSFRSKHYASGGSQYSLVKNLLIIRLSDSLYAMLHKKKLVVALKQLENGSYFILKECFELF